MANAKKADLEEKLERPADHFASPADIVKDASLSPEEKKKALSTWEQDARQLVTASNEGMPGSEEGHKPDDRSRLGEVMRAEEAIGLKPKHKPAH
jgi:hypothetical protein